MHCQAMLHEQMQEAIEKKVQIMKIILSTTYVTNTKCINSYFRIN